jgi:integrase
MEKTDKDIVLPLLNDVGEAIIDYLKHGRPACDNSFIFVRHITPILPITAPGMTTIVKRYVNKAGIDSSPYGKGGPHAMRSTLATLLLENNIPIPTISEILGHSNTRTTESHYLKLDIPQLRKCCLDVPPYDWNRNDREVF